MLRPRAALPRSRRIITAATALAAEELAHFWLGNKLFFGLVNNADEYLSLFQKVLHKCAPVWKLGFRRLGADASLALADTAYERIKALCAYIEVDSWVFRRRVTSKCDGAALVGVEGLAEELADAGGVEDEVALADALALEDAS